MQARGFRSAVRFAATVLAGSCAVGAAGALNDDDRRGIEETLRARIESLLEDRNEGGAARRRGAYSRNFRAVDPSTCEVTFHRDTASKDRLTTERLLLTLARSPGPTGWEITSEEVRDTYDGLVRFVPGDEDFYSFDSFSLDREGLSVAAGPGNVFVDYLNGEAARMVVAARRLEHRYEPPLDMDYPGHHIYRYLKEEKPRDFDFDARVVNLACTPLECGKILEGAFEKLTPVSREDVRPALREAHDELITAQRNARSQNGFSGFRRPFQPGNRSWVVAIKRKSARDHWLWLAFNNWAGWEVVFGTSRRGPILAYYARDTRESGIPAYALERRVDLDARDFDLRGVRGTVELALIDSSTMTADLTFELTIRRTLRELPFRISRMRRGGGPEREVRRPSMFVNSIRDGDGNELTWVKLGPAGGLVVLPEEVPPGTKLELRVQFENRGAIAKIWPSYSAVARGGWLPFVRFSDMIEEWDLTVKVPAEYKTLSVGKKVSEAVEGEVDVSRWVSTSPVSFPTVIFGQYVEAEPGIEARKRDGTPIPVVIQADRFGMRQWDIRPKQLPALAEEAVNALNLYREIFDMDYPYSKLDLVNDPFGFLYGQSPASIVYLGSGAFRGEGALGSFGGSQLTTFTKSLVAHEVGHQWWGSLILNANSRNYWFVESLAEYSSALFVEAINGREDPSKGWQAYLEHVRRWRDEILDAALTGNVQNASELWSGGYRAALYAKGPYAFHMLRVTFGDAKLLGFLRRLARELAGKEVVTRDIQRVAEEAFGTDMEWFFDQWIRGVGMPVYEFEYEVSATEDGTHLVKGSILQKVVLGRKKRTLKDTYYRGITTIVVTARKTRTEYRVPVRIEGPETPFAFKVPEEPLEVVLNKHGEILAHDVHVAAVP